MFNVSLNMHRPFKQRNITIMRDTKYFGDASATFIQQIREISSDAAECLEQIEAAWGVRAAYLAGFALVILKERYSQHAYAVTQKELYGFTFYEEMRANAEALSLYEAAAAHLFEDFPSSDDTQSAGLTSVD